MLAELLSALSCHRPHQSQTRLQAHALAHSCPHLQEMPEAMDYSYSVTLSVHETDLFTWIDLRPTWSS